MLRNLLECRTSPTFFCPPMNPHTSPLRNSFLSPAVSVISPLLSQAPHSLKQNPTSVSFLFLFLVPFHSSPDRSYCRFPFSSCMLSTLDSAATAQLCRSTVFHPNSSCFTSLPILSPLIGQPFSLVTISLLGDSDSPYFTWSVCCPCIVYKTASFVSPLLS